MTLDTQLLKKHGVLVMQYNQHYVAVLKPRGLVTVSLNGHPSLQGVLRDSEPDFSTYAPAHRLDRDTTGIVIGGITKRGRSQLAGQLRNRQTKKYYLAAVDATPDVGTHFDIRYPLDIDKRRNLVATCETGTSAHTEAMAIGHLDLPDLDERVGLLLVRLHTGRRHQIRVHLEAAGMPVHGDPFYNKTPGDAQMLHSASISFGVPGERYGRTLTACPDWIPKDILSKNDLRYMIKQFPNGR